MLRGHGPGMQPTGREGVLIVMINDEPERDPARGGTYDESQTVDVPGEGGVEPEESMVPEAVQPETQGDAPIEAELGDEGQGDIAPEDV